MAIALSDTYPGWLGWAAVAVGIGWVVLGLLVAHNGFTQVTLNNAGKRLLGLWLLVLAGFLMVQDWQNAKSIRVLGERQQVESAA